MKESAESPEVLNWVHLIAKMTEPSSFSEFLMKWEHLIYMLIVLSLVALFFVPLSRNLSLKPGRKQSFAEMLISGLDDVVCGIMGPRGRGYTPFVGSIFIYILISNLFGLIPLQNSIMGFITTTAPIALVVFLYVQWTGITKNGLKGYLFHLAGSPENIYGWLLVPLMMPLHIMGEFIKPVSLAFRLFGNIMAGHILLAVFMMIGISCLKPLHIPIGIPFHVPFLFLEILVSVIQAFVFTLLSTIYIAMMLPHEHSNENHEKHTEAAHEIAAH